MKKINRLFLPIVLLGFMTFNFSIAQTQVLFGTCTHGGGVYGTIFQADLDGSNLHTVHSFVIAEGLWPWGKIVQAPNGKIYGVTYLGGCADSCTLYEYDPVASTCANVYDFYCNPPYSGEPSQNGLISLPDGNLYGLQQNGIIYKFNPNTHIYTPLQQTAGAVYYGGLTQATDGKLYGVSFSGGIYNKGYIFNFDLISQMYSVVYSFDSIHGANPYVENLIQATDGKLYGTARSGGDNGWGVIFSYDLLSNNYTVLHNFSYGHSPWGGLIQATDGKLYGMTGGYSLGVIFNYDISSGQYLVLYNFNTTNGVHPQGGLMQASNGKLFGTTYSGGLNSSGVAFSYDITSSIYSKLIDFNSTTGYNPQCDILEATLPIVEGITYANNSSASIYIDATNQLIVNSSGLEGKVEIMMFDALGKKVLQAEVNSQKSQFDMSSYSRGVYFVMLKTEEKAVTQKIILTK